MKKKLLLFLPFLFAVWNMTTILAQANVLLNICSRYDSANQSADDLKEMKPDLVPYTLFDHFETNEKHGWDPYPYEQDVGTTRFFLTRQSPSYKGSQYALHRPMAANDAGEVYHGFTKRINMWTTPETRIQTAIFIQADRNPDMLEVSLGTFDGRRYLHTIHNPEANVWLELDIPVSEFSLDGQSLESGENIQVVTLKGSFSTSYYLMTYTFVMDHFRFIGERQRQFQALNNGSTYFDKFDVSVLNRHFYYGDSIDLSIVPEDGDPVTMVTGILVDSNGDVVLDHIQFTNRNGEWVNEAVYQLSERDARGQWKFKLNGITECGSEVRWDLGFLMPGVKVTGHPRLFFSSEELQQRLKNEQSPVAKRILEKALADTDFMDVNIDEINQWEDVAGEALAGGPYGKYSYGHGGFSIYRNPPMALGDVIRAGSFRYAFTGDIEAAMKAKEALLKLCSFTSWAPRWKSDLNMIWYHTGYIVKPIAYGYDLLYHILTEEERALIREAMIEKGLKLYHRDLVEMNRMPSNVTNHIAVKSAGMGLIATAIYGDDPNNPYMEPYLSGIMIKGKTFIDRVYYEDGSYAEPYNYTDMASRSLVEIAAAFERNFGVDWSTTTNMQHFWKYPIRATDANNLIQAWGDTPRTYNGFNQIHTWWFIHRLGNPYLYDYAKKYWEEGNGGYMGYLWYRDDLESISREKLPTSDIYSAQGMVMRSGWDDASTIITNRIGPNSNHYHYDMGSFQVMTNGDELLSDPGINSGGYYSGLFTVYDIHSIAHNVMLVDHDSESQAPAHYDLGIAALEDWPQMVHAFAGEIADAVEGDLAIVYKNKLEKYNRTLLYTKTGPIFLFDEVKSTSPDGHMYNWLFHAPQNDGLERSITYDNNRMVIKRPNARLVMDVISPEVYSTRITERYDANHPENWLTVNSHPALTETNFLAVLLPEAKPEVGTYDSLPETRRIDAPGWIGAKVERPGFVDFGFFRTTDKASDTVSGFTTDAKRFTAMFKESGELQKVYFEGRLLSGHDLKIQTNQCTTIALTLVEAGFDIEIDSEDTVEMKVSWKMQHPAQVLLNEESMSNWDYDVNSMSLVLKVPKGRNDLSVR